MRYRRDIQARTAKIKPSIKSSGLSFPDNLLNACMPALKCSSTTASSSPHKISIRMMLLLVFRHSASSSDAQAPGYVNFSVTRLHLPKALVVRLHGHNTVVSFGVWAVTHFVGVIFHLGRSHAFCPVRPTAGSLPCRRCYHAFTCYVGTGVVCSTCLRSILMPLDVQTFESVVS